MPPIHLVTGHASAPGRPAPSLAVVPDIRTKPLTVTSHRPSRAGPTDIGAVQPLTVCDDLPLLVTRLRLTTDRTARVRPPPRPKSTSELTLWSSVSAMGSRPRASPLVTLLHLDKGKRVLGCSSLPCPTNSSAASLPSTLKREGTHRSFTKSSASSHNQGNLAHVRTRGRGQIVWSARSGCLHLLHCLCGSDTPAARYRHAKSVLYP